MKRSSEEKVKSSPKKQDATKLRNVQKAYGILPKDVSQTKTKTGTTSRTPGSTSTRGGAASVTSSNQTSTRNPVRNSIGSSPKTEKNLTRSNAPETTTTKKSTSKIIAASKANYVDKYGSPTGGGGVRTSVSKGSTSKQQPGGGSTSTGRKPASIKSKSSTSSKTSNLVAQKPPPAFYESDIVSEPVPDDYEDDFEEPYESDFEEMVSSEEEEEPEEEPEKENETMESNEKSRSIVETVPDEVDEVEEEYDKSSSTKEFEKLEKLVEKETVAIFSLENQISAYNVEVGGSGEPGDKFSFRDADENGRQDDNDNEEEEEEDEEEEEANSQHESPQVKRQVAFPTTSGFSINTLQQQNVVKPPLQQQKRELSGGSKRNDSWHQENIPNDGYNVSSKDPTKENKSQKITRTQRGKIIQSMIKLDRVQVELLNLVPYQYERFMAVFSGADRLQQASTQTDVEKCEESAQTESIDQISKWTQKPPTWSTTNSSCDIRIVRQEALGVGSDDICEDFSTDQKIHKQFDFLKNWEQLSKFILRSSRKILCVLEAEDRIQLVSNSGGKGSLETIKMSRGLPVLSKLLMHTLACDGEFVACANGQIPDAAGLLPLELESKTTNGNKKHTSKNLITAWSLKEPSMPLYFLRVWGHVISLKLHMIGRMVISGNKDGSISVWNLDEPQCYHSLYQEHTIRTPSTNTSCMLPGHELPIVGIEMSSDSKNTFTIVSLDKEGNLITWSCLRAHDALGESSLSQHSSAWSTIHISIRHQIKLRSIIKDHLHITCFQVCDPEISSILFGTYNGYVVKCQREETITGESIEKYQERLDCNPRITCMDVSRILNILVLGCEDGRCRLFEMSRKKMVLSLGGTEEPVRVQWSGRRASVLYVALRGSLLIWDLLVSDMNPWKTIHLKDIQDFVLYSPPHKEYLVIVSGKDLIVSTPADEVKPLSNRDFARIQSYISLLC
ncbi:unnamed protein product [Orchesella dallaii]|uniref:WD repeat-containing protein 60 n=1 Tax=Orchesella dallaii TaxID=48710 RepID=A0ABP1S7U9_9HEXA